MFRTRRDALTTLLGELRSLPETTLVYTLSNAGSDAWFVVSTSGLFVFSADNGDLGASCSTAASAADALRLSLCDQLVFVPFIDAMCATADPSFDPAQPCLVIPADLVSHTVTGGPRTIDSETFEKLSLLGLPRLQ